MNKKTTDMNKDTKAIHQGGTPADPPANIAVSLPPAHSAPINAIDQVPNA